MRYLLHLNQLIMTIFVPTLISYVEHTRHFPIKTKRYAIPNFFFLMSSTTNERAQIILIQSCSSSESNCPRRSIQTENPRLETEQIKQQSFMLMSPLTDEGLEQRRSGIG